MIIAASVYECGGMRDQKIKVNVTNDQITREGKVNCVYLFDALKAGFARNFAALSML